MRVLYYRDHREGGRLFGPIVEEAGAFFVRGKRLPSLSDAIAVAPEVDLVAPEARALLLKVQEGAAPGDWSGEIVAL